MVPSKKKNIKSKKLQSKIENLVLLSKISPFFLASPTTIHTPTQGYYPLYLRLHKHPGRNEISSNFFFSDP